jgi:hypothetical protein
VSSIASGWKRSNYGAFNYDTSQSTGRKGAGVDVDSIRSEIGCVDRRMPVNDEALELLLAGKKFVTYPEQVFLFLLLDRNARPNTGVDKEEISAGEREIERLEKFEMCLGHARSQLLGEIQAFRDIGIDRRL